jgi:hypothetical protein
MSTTIASARSQTTSNFAASCRGEMAGGRQWRPAFNITVDREPSSVATATGQSLINGHDTLGRRYQFSVNLEF